MERTKKHISEPKHHKITSAFNEDLAFLALKTTSLTRLRHFNHIPSHNMLFSNYLLLESLAPWGWNTSKIILKG